MKPTPTGRPPAPPPAERGLQTTRRLAHLLDAALPIPGTRWRVGLDALLGLVPGFGDLAGALLSAHILVVAARLRAPRALLLRMAANIGVEAVLGAVPLLGDLFDVAWKANLRNLRLLEAHLEAPERAERASRGWLLALVAGLVALLIGAGALAIWLVLLLLRALGAG